MKRIGLVLVIFINSHLALFAQTYYYIPLVDTISKEWVSMCSFPVMGNSNTIGGDYLMDGDTMINGYKYQTILGSSNYFYWTSRDYQGAVLEDSIKRVFYKSYDDTTASIGKMIFNFSLAANDSIVLDNSTLVVLSVDTILLGNVFRKRFSLSSGDVWVEGIGSLRYGIIQCCMCSHWPSAYLCLTDQDGSRIYTNSAAACHRITSVEEISIQEIDVYPNPADDYIIISGYGNFSNYDLSLYSITGKMVTGTRGNNFISKIDLSNFPAGIYLLELVNDRGNLTTRKIIKN